VDLPKGYLNHFHLSGDSNTQSEKPVNQLTPNLTNWLSHCWPQAKPGWDSADAAFSDPDGELVKRSYSCALEIFVRALGNDPTKYDRRAAQSIGAIMQHLEPEWMPGPYARCGRWGRQRTYVLVGGPRAGRKRLKG
jgi:hypothetical protein